MPNAVEILFRSNPQEVIRDISSISAALDKLAQRAGSTSERSVRTRIRGEQDAARATERSAKETARTVEKIDREVEREKERRLREGRRQQDKAMADEVRAVERSARDKERAEERLAKNRERIVQNSLRMEQTLRERASREQESRARVLGRIGSGAVQRGLGVAGRIAGVAGAIGGGFAIADALQTGIGQQSTAGQIVRSAANTGGLTKTDVLESARGAATGTGGRTDDILAGLNKFVAKTGDLQAGKEMLQDLATQAAATGANFEDMGNTAAEVFNQLGDQAQTKDVMRALIGQGMTGAIDIRDLGQYGGRLAAGAAQFAGPLAGNIESFGALAQLAKKLGGATDTAEATESVARLSSDVTKHSDAFKQAGIEVFADKNHTKLRNAEDIITEAVVKTKGDIGKLHDMFGERSIRAVMGAQVAFSNAGGGAAGEAAIRKAIADVKAFTPSQEQLQDKLGDKLTEPESKINIALENFQAAINTKLLPVLPPLIDSFSKLIPPITDLAGHLATFLAFLAEKPWAGIGILVGGSIVAEIAKAGLSGSIEKAIIALLTAGRPPPIPTPGGGIPVPSAGGSMTFGGFLARGTAVVSAGVGGFELGKYLAEQGGSASDAAKRGATAADLETSNVRSVLAGVTSGRTTPEQAKATLDEARRMIADAQEGTGAGARIKSGAITALTGQTDAPLVAKDEFLNKSKPLQDAIELLAKVIRDQAGSIADIQLPSASPAGPGGQAGPNWPP